MKHFLGGSRFFSQGRIALGQEYGVISFAFEWML